MDLLVGEMTLRDGEVTFMGLSSEALKFIACELEKRNKRFNSRSKVFAKKMRSRQIEKKAMVKDDDKTDAS